MNKIITRYILHSDGWIAYHKGDGRSSKHKGYGLMEAEALADLALKDEERAEAFLHIAFRDEADALVESGQ